jgi:hypothetical protein
MMSMPRAYVIRTTQGFTLEFEKDTPVMVPDNLKVMEACRAAGAIYVDPQEMEVVVEREKAKPQYTPASPEERRKTILDLFREMKENQVQHRQNFTAVGRPNAKYVTSTLGFDVSVKEVETLWMVTLHPELAEAV